MSDAPEALETFRQEAAAWLDAHFPKSLAGRAAELMAGEFVESDMRFRELVVALVLSEPFRMRRAGDGGE